MLIPCTGESNFCLRDKRQNVCSQLHYFLVFFLFVKSFGQLGVCMTPIYRFTGYWQASIYYLHTTPITDSVHRRMAFLEQTMTAGRHIFPSLPLTCYSSDLMYFVDNKMTISLRLTFSSIKVKQCFKRSQSLKKHWSGFLIPLSQGCCTKVATCFKPHW